MFSFFKKKPATGSSVSFKISGMHCSSCSMNIDGALEDKPGVLSADTSYARATTKVTYDTSKITEAELKQVIKELGYTAQAT